jgi:hypothetical protein
MDPKMPLAAARVLRPLRGGVLMLAAGVCLSVAGAAAADAVERLAGGVDPGRPAFDLAMFLVAGFLLGRVGVEFLQWRPGRATA